MLAKCRNLWIVMESVMEELKSFFAEMRKRPDASFYERYLARKKLPWYLLLLTYLYFVLDKLYLGRRHPQVFAPWTASLHKAAPNGKTVLIWDDLGDVARSRQACGALNEIFAGKDIAPVLLTSVKDFTFYGRLGWLVEYLPDLCPQEKDYRKSKLRHLAWRYEKALPLPLSLGLQNPDKLNAFLEEILID